MIRETTDKTRTADRIITDKLGAALVALAKGEARCATCHAPAVAVRRTADGKPAPICANPLCRENQELDALAAALKADRSHATRRSP